MGAHVNPRGRLSGGLIILVRSGLPYTRTLTRDYGDIDNSYMTLGVLLHLPRVPPLSIINVCFRPGLHLQDVPLPELPGERRLVVGNINAHHPTRNVEAAPQ